MAKNKEIGKLSRCVALFDDEEAGELTAFQIAAAYKAALSDFVSGKTSRKSIAEVAKLLAGALAARRQAIIERDELTSQRCHQFYN